MLVGVGGEEAGDRADPVRLVVDEVDDVVVLDAVDQVAERAAEHEREAPPERPLPRRELAVERDDEQDRDHRDGQEERAPDRLGLVLEQAPRAALVARDLNER